MVVSSVAAVLHLLGGTVNSTVRRNEVLGCKGIIDMDAADPSRGGVDVARCGKLG